MLFQKRYFEAIVVLNEVSQFFVFINTLIKIPERFFMIEQSQLQNYEVAKYLKLVHIVSYAFANWEGLEEIFVGLVIFTKCMKLSS